MVEPLVRLFRALEEFRKLDPEMPMQHAAVLLLLKEEPGISQKDLTQRIGLSKQSMSRAFRKLSDRDDGLGLISVREDANDGRYKVASLTPKGLRVISSLEQMVED